MVEAYKQPIAWVNVAARVSGILGRENVRFIWVGDGALRDAAEHHAHSFSSLADISFVGSRSDVGNYYKSSHLYFQYSSIENMSLAVIDALRHGLPSVVTDVGGLPEIIEDGVTGRVISPTSEEEAALAITSILSGDAVLQHLELEAKIKYRKQFSVSQWEREILKIHADEGS